MFMIRINHYFKTVTLDIKLSNSHWLNSQLFKHFQRKIDNAITDVIVSC